MPSYCSASKPRAKHVGFQTEWFQTYDLCLKTTVKLTTLKNKVLLKAICLEEILRMGSESAQRTTYYAMKWQIRTQQIHIKKSRFFRRVQLWNEDHFYIFLPASQQSTSIISPIVAWFLFFIPWCMCWSTSHRIFDWRNIEMPWGRRFKIDIFNLQKFITTFRRADGFPQQLIGVGGVGSNKWNDKVI